MAESSAAKAGVPNRNGAAAVALAGVFFRATRISRCALLGALYEEALKAARDSLDGDREQVRRQTVITALQGIIAILEEA
mgnify:CR=1 FL=1